MTLWALEHGVDLALANKESLVAAGELALAAKERARRDVARALKEEVKVDWTEDEVDDLVDDVLNEGDEDEEEEGDESW